MRPAIKKDFAAKIAILYIINKFGEAIEEEKLTDIALSVCEINYFIFRQCAYELSQTNFIRHYPSDGAEYYVLTDKGKQAVDLFATKLIYSLRVEINEYIKNYSPDKTSKNKFVCDYTPVSDLEYNVKLSYNEGVLPLMQLELRAGDREQAREIMLIMSKNKERIYTDVYNYIMKLAAENKKENSNTIEDEHTDSINFFE